jgi:2-C-methyl-D-erythritol 4-phosphate cytidylyltransferase/2-C-methyl-D-erythritol 2,4-cyclodiphosphate synthase
MAGSGTRLGLDINKMMYKVNNKRLYQYPLEKFLSLGLDVILVTNETDYNTVLEETKGIKNLIVVKGGKTRNESVKNALVHVKTKRVMIHDAARVLVSEQIIKDCLNNNSDLYYVCIPLKDTIRTSNNKTLNRSELLSVQTPQGGLTELFFKYNDLSTTDDISSFENLDYKIDKINGSDYNFKLTTKFDLEILKNIILGGQYDSYR